MATACSIVLSERPGRAITLWTRTAERAHELATSRENRRLLPGVAIPDSIRITHDAATAVGPAELLVVAIPTRYLRETLQRIARQAGSELGAGVPAVSVVKGLEVGTLMRPSEIVCEALGERPVVALSGPSHAEEVARRLPASLVAACPDLALAARAQELFTTDRFRVYTNDDLLGVELAGALKNVLAIAAGVCDGQGFGDNAKSALVTRGLVELTRFGATMGAKASTFFGLAGLGDLVATCFSPHSRNRHVGECLGRGQSLDRILAEMNGVAEGVTATRSVHDLAIARRIDMPITAEVYAVLFEGKSPHEATESLMLRPLRGEG
jgi:glycerol-3-phosphate dehydrogenase (NAD(P)+)